MKTVYVNIQEDIGGVLVGRSTVLELSNENLRAIYGEDSPESFKADTFSNGPIRLFEKFRQFVIIIQTTVYPYHVIIDFIDCEKDMDKALDFYSSPTIKEQWDEIDKAYFMEAFNLVLTDNEPDNAKLSFIGD